MKKTLKVTLIILGIIVGIIVLDSLQAIFFNNNPIIGIETKCHVRKGILVNTYHLGDGKNLTKFRFSSYAKEYDCIQDINYNVTNIENVIMNISNISFSGATITIKDTNETPYIYGEWYVIQKEENGKWENLEPIIDNFGFNDIGYEVNDNKELKFDVNWQWLYGELPQGSYRIIKSVDNKYISVEFAVFNTLLDGVSLKVKEETLTTKGGTFVLINNTNDDYTYESAYFLEKKENNGWFEIEPREPLLWNMILYTIKANESVELNIDWSFGYGELPSGEYRLVKKNLRKENSADSMSYSIYGEFTIK